MARLKCGTTNWHQAHEPQARKRVHCIKDKACAGIRPWDAAQDKKDEVYSKHTFTGSGDLENKLSGCSLPFFLIEESDLISVEFVVGHVAWLPMQWAGLDRRSCDSVVARGGVQVHDAAKYICCIWHKFLFNEARVSSSLSPNPHRCLMAAIRALPVERRGGKRLAPGTPRDTNYSIIVTTEDAPP